MHELAAEIIALVAAHWVHFSFAIKHEPGVPAAQERIVHRCRDRLAVVIPLHQIVRAGQVLVPPARRLTVDPVEPGGIDGAIGIG